MTHHKQHHEPLDEAKHAQQQDQPQAEPTAAAAKQTPRDELAKVKAERDDFLTRLQRVSADFVNYQKRASREVLDARELANADLIKNLLPVLDDMERALEAAQECQHADDPLLAGMKLVYDKAATTLERFGVQTIDAQDKPFDPALHQAVMHIASDQHAPGTVIKVLQKGYTLKGRLLRPATVVVSKAPEAQ